MGRQLDSQALKCFFALRAAAIVVASVALCTGPSPVCGTVKAQHDVEVAQPLDLSLGDDAVRHPGAGVESRDQVALAKVANLSGSGSGRSLIDVMVLYTGTAREAYGEAGVRAKIALSIAFLNEACHRSGVNAKFRLVYQGETTWHAESSPAASELCWLSGDPTVRQLRDQTGADLVSLFVRDGF